MLTVRGLARSGLRPFDLDLAAGECVAMMGPSGAGKTLVLRAIADLDPNEGRVGFEQVDRDAIPAPRWRRLVGYLPAEPGWWADLAGDHFGDLAAARDAVAALGLPAEVLGAPVSRLSTGERRRVALARLLVQRPRVLLLDEPTSGLDEASTMRVEQVLRQRLAAAAAILMATHDRAQAARLADRCLAIEGGRLGGERPCL